ncbi:hypothetical protein N7478_004127 [Penicillium angulare]|uniref:uncharacterized protein n=1 Tax=Penicillium angulare TaxID=116970 RepID=UPI00254233D1|nr:uncharacterized protein N7478_004127 [Penicillium angulare]KAJ5278755.1 hypothetical protein N7478_004127 [Penicillium angulare]
MRFTSVVSAVVLAGAATAAMPAQEVTTNIDKITELSSQTNDIAEKIGVTNFFSTAPQVVNNFKDIIETATKDIAAMKKSDKRSLKARQECLNLTNPEQCLNDLEDIVEDPSEILGSKKKRQDPGYSDSDQNAICTSFRGFVQVHQQLLSTVIGKHGILSLTPFTKPIAAVLEQLEGGVDTLAFLIIDSVPTCAEDATSNKNMLDKSLEKAQDTYKD